MRIWTSHSRADFDDLRKSLSRRFQIEQSGPSPAQRKHNASPISCSTTSAEPTVSDQRSAGRLSTLEARSVAITRASMKRCNSACSARTIRQSIVSFVRLQPDPPAHSQILGRLIPQLPQTYKFVREAPTPSAPSPDDLGDQRPWHMALSRSQKTQVSSPASCPYHTLANEITFIPGS